MSQEAKLHGWEMRTPGQPLEAVTRPLPVPQANEALVRVAGCGVCHTDIGFLYGGVRTRMAPPLILGHEIAGVVEAAGPGLERLVGKNVVVPAVIPCGACDVCRRGRGSICAKQVFPGNDVHGGFASHVLVPARGLAEVDLAGASFGDSGVGLAELAVVADAVSTAYQAVRRSQLAPGDLAIFVGAGGVGGFGVQIANALGAKVVAVDVDKAKLDLIAQHGAALTLDAREKDQDGIKAAVKEFAKAQGLRSTEWRVFETSGTKPGQELAFKLLVSGSYLGVVGYTRDPVSLRLSNLMALDARAEGNWGCVPELYPEVLDLVRRGLVKLAPFVEKHPLSDVNDVLTAMHEGTLKRRVVLVP